MKKISTILIIFTLGFSQLLQAQYEPKSIYLQQPDTIIDHLLESADFWKKSIDREDGGFYSFVNRDGTPNLTTRKSFVQCSRHAYGFSRAFMLSGDETYLDYAEHALQFVYDHGWDDQHLGWLFSSDKVGNPSPPYGGGWNPNNEKWSFQQHYNLLGIAAMVEATRDSLHTAWLEQGIQTNDNFLWDGRSRVRGYFNTADVDWNNKRGKGFTPTVDAVTTWVLAKTLLDDQVGDENRLLQITGHIIDYLYASMFLPEVKIGFAEVYNNNWEIDESSNGASTGHVIKTAWCLARAYMFDPKPEYLEAAQFMIDDIMDKGGYDEVNGGLWGNINWATNSVTKRKNHWMLEQGVTGGLMNYFIAEDQADRDQNLRMADGCMEFYMEHFIDEEYGECYLETDGNGNITRDSKSDPFKGGYHNIELAYLVYVYGNLFLHQAPISLYYRFDAQPETRTFKMTPLAIRDDLLTISSVELDGINYSNFESKDRLLTLPPNTYGIFKVTYNLEEVIVSAKELKTLPAINVYPNPVQDYLFVSNLPTQASISIFNLEGKPFPLHSGRAMALGTPIDVRALPAGFYVLSVQEGGRISQQKFVKY